MSTSALPIFSVHKDVEYHTENLQQQRSLLHALLCLFFLAINLFFRIFTCFCHTLIEEAPHLEQCMESRYQDPLESLFFSHSLCMPIIILWDLHPVFMEMEMLEKLGFHQLRSLKMGRCMHEEVQDTFTMPD